MHKWLWILVSVSWSAMATPLRLAYPAASTIVSAQVGLIFEKTDILRKRGFEADVVSIGTGRELKTALVSGQADVILTSQSNFIVLLGEEFPAVAINSLGSAGRLALVAKADSKINGVSDLAGKTVATIFGTSLHQPAIEWTQKTGAKVINISQVGALHTALETGSVDAVMTYDPFLTELESGNKIKILKDDRFDLITVCSRKFAKENAARMAALNEAFKDAVVYMREHRAEVDAWFSERAKLDRTAVERASRLNVNYTADAKAPVDLKISDKFRDKLVHEAAFLLQEKVIRHNPDISQSILQ